MGLFAALEQLAQRYGSEAQQQVQVEVAIYRTTQEALTNVVRHAQANRCEVRLDVKEEVNLQITDDGVGIPRERTAGVGLSSMRERAEELGGKCSIEAAPEGGTQVLVRLPLPKE